MRIVTYTYLPRHHTYRSYNLPIFKYWNRNQNRVKAIWNQPSSKYASDNGQPNFLPIIGLSCIPAKGIAY